MHDYYEERIIKREFDYKILLIQIYFHLDVICNSFVKDAVVVVVVQKINTDSSLFFNNPLVTSFLPIRRPCLKLSGYPSKGNSELTSCSTRNRLLATRYVLKLASRSRRMS